jgi:ribose-phosphate pyrophosphokinase
VPVDHLHALRELAAPLQGYDLASTVVVSPDLGNALAEAVRRIHNGESVSALSH